MGRLGNTAANTSINAVTATIATTGLSTTEPALDGTGITEPSGNAYARAASTSWTSAASRFAWNSAAVTFPTPTGSGWGTPRFYVHFDGSGNYITHERINKPVTILAGAVVVFAIGALPVRAPS